MHLYYISYADLGTEVPFKGRFIEVPTRIVDTDTLDQARAQLIAKVGRPILLKDIIAFSEVVSADSDEETERPSTKLPGSPAALCEERGWSVGSVISGRNLRPDGVLEITAIGRSQVLMRELWPIDDRGAYTPAIRHESYLPINILTKSNLVEVSLWSSEAVGTAEQASPAYVVRERGWGPGVLLRASYRFAPHTPEWHQVVEIVAVGKYEVLARQLWISRIGEPNEASGNTEKIVNIAGHDWEEITRTDLDALAAKPVSDSPSPVCGNSTR